MKRIFLLLLTMPFCMACLAQISPYDNKKTATGEIYRAIYHSLDTKFPTVGRITTLNVWHTIREEIDGGQSSFFYEIWYDYGKPEKARFSVEDLRNIIPALEQIYKDGTDDKGGASMYFAKNGFVIGYDTEAYGKWRISLCKVDGFEV